MVKTTRDEELTVVIFGQFYGNVLTVGWRAFADINGYIKNGTFDASNQLGLGERRGLEVKASHYAISRHRLVVLYELDAMTKDWGHSFIEVSLGETLEEVSTNIAKYFWLYNW